MPLLSDQDRRKRNLIVICGFLILLVVATAFEFGIRTPDIPVASTIVVFALFNLNLIVFLLLLVLLFRNLVKLSFERRQKVIGSRFKAKLVLAFLLLALAPAILIFIIASNFINTSIEGWFKPQVERPLDQALSVAQTYYQNLEATALRHGQHVARAIARDGLLAEDRRVALAAYLVEQQEQLGLSALTVFNAGGHDLVHVKDPVLGDLPTAEISARLVRQGLDGQEVTTVREIQAGDLIQAVTPVWSVPAGERGRHVIGAVVAATHVAERLEAKVRGISQAFTEYKQLKLLKNPIKGIYILMFLLMTLIIVFSFTWFGLYLARGITVPIEQLAQGTREVAAGNLSYRVQARADDEIGILVDSFNRMTADLAQSKTRLEAAYLDLQAKHGELEGRRRYTETVLEAVATGVVSFDVAGRLTTMNRAAARMLGLPAAASPGQPLREVFAGRDFDDITELVLAQRTSAWADVARRIAHEIKNPLTPIQLSAERLRRKYGKLITEDRAIFEQCTDTIVRQVDDIRRMVDEFSRFARMPKPVITSEDAADAVRQVVFLMRVGNADIDIDADFAEDPMPARFDRRLISQALTNIIKNATEAISAVPPAELGRGRIHLTIAREGGDIVIDVIDNGVGLPKENRSRLLEPYVTTREKGTGLGLAIVGKILEDHGGRIELRDAADKTPGARGAWVRLRFAAAAVRAAPAADTSAPKTTTAASA